MQHGLEGHHTLLGRYGGEEFVLVLAGSTQAEISRLPIADDAVPV